MAIIMEDMEVLTSILEDTMEVDQTGTNKEHVQEAITVADLITIVLATQIEIVLDDKSVVQTDLVQEYARARALLQQSAWIPVWHRSEVEVGVQGGVGVGSHDEPGLVARAGGSEPSSAGAAVESLRRRLRLRSRV